MNPHPQRVATQDWPEKSVEIAQLLAHAGLGDRRAFAKLYERTSGHLLAVVLRIQRDRAQAEDLLQDTYVEIVESAPDLASSSSPSCSPTSPTATTAPPSPTPFRPTT